MTNNKMIKILKSYEDMVLFEIKDAAKYDFETDSYNCPVREVILLSDIIKEFESKCGIIYDEFHFTDSFKKLIDLIETGKTECRYKMYEDSIKEMEDNWGKYHPNESYDEVRKRKQKEKKKQDDKDWADLIGLYGSLLNYIYPYPSIPWNHKDKIYS